jgi:3-hydroxyisobutyrate dehydrogenase-like beta-hydroxyacid dehydrogenase
MAFIDLGIMGSPMTANLTKFGPKVRVFDFTEANIREL